MSARKGWRAVVSRDARKTQHHHPKRPKVFKLKGPFDLYNMHRVMALASEETCMWLFDTPALADDRPESCHQGGWMQLGMLCGVDSLLVGRSS